MNWALINERLVAMRERVLGEAAKVGERHKWKDGKYYVKQADGRWKPEPDYKRAPLKPGQSWTDRVPGKHGLVFRHEIDPEVARTHSSRLNAFVDEPKDAQPVNLDLADEGGNPDSKDVEKKVRKYGFVTLRPNTDYREQRFLAAKNGRYYEVSPRASPDNDSVWSLRQRSKEDVKDWVLKHHVGGAKGPWTQKDWSDFEAQAEKTSESSARFEGFRRLAGLTDVRVLTEGKKARPGEVRRWGDGHDYEKQADGSWKKVAAKSGTSDPLAKDIAASITKAKEIRTAPPAPTTAPAAPSAPTKLTKFKGALTWTADDPRNPENKLAAVKAPNGDIYNMYVGRGWTADGMKHSDKFKAHVFGPMSVPLVNKDGFPSREAAEEFAKQTVLDAMNAKMGIDATPKAPSKPASEVKSALNGRKTKTGGRLKLTDADGDSLSFEPEYRQRLDHYGTSRSDDGDEQEGWDDEGWEADYAGPLRREVEAMLKSAGVDDWVVDVGEKGHVEVQLPRRA